MLEMLAKKTDKIFSKVNKHEAIEERIKKLDSID